MIETFFSANSIAVMAPTQCEDIQIPYLNDLIAFIRFEGQSLAVTFLLGKNKIRFDKFRPFDYYLSQKKGVS